MKLTLPRTLPSSVLALGGDLKCRPVFAEGDQAELLDEVGDLESPEAQDVLEDVVASRRPARLVCDGHPGYFSTTLAQRVAAERGLALAQVQHHRAHVAAVCLEHDLFEEPVVGLAFDGTGYGDDGVAWGGEFFTGSLATGFARRAHFAPLPLPGGDRAVREPWRIALALLLERGATDAEIDNWLKSRAVPLDDLALFRQGLRARLAVGRSTSVGRWFDAMSALLGVRIAASFEAEPAIALQKLAEENACDNADADWPFAVSDADPAIVDFPSVRELAARSVADAPRLAYAFHAGAAGASAEAAIRLARATGATRVLVAGGVFFNRLFANLLAARVEAAGLQYVKPVKLLPGDQAIALGQVGLVLAAGGV